MSERGFRHSCGSRDGFIVVAALWILSALAALASVYSIYVANVATSVAVNDDQAEPRLLVRDHTDSGGHRRLEQARRRVRGRVGRVGRVRLMVYRPMLAKSE